MNAKKCKALRRAALKHSNPATVGYDVKGQHKAVGHVMVEGKPQVLIATTAVSKHKQGSASQVYKFLKGQVRRGKI